ncbi:MAG TPA: hypothetical protein VF623_03545, partial [Segetibacter sp.]
MYKFLIFSLLIAMLPQVYTNAQPKSDQLLEDLLFKNNNSIIQEVSKNPAKFRCQVIYTQINRDKNNIPSFKNYYFNYDPTLYFNPASMVKMPLAFLSLEKLNTMNVRGVDKNTPALFDSSFPGQKILHTD